MAVSCVFTDRQLRDDEAADHEKDKDPGIAGGKIAETVAIVDQVGGDYHQGADAPPAVERKYSLIRGIGRRLHFVTLGSVEALRYSSVTPACAITRLG